MTLAEWENVCILAAKTIENETNKDYYRYGNDGYYGNDGVYGE